MSRRSKRMSQVKDTQTPKAGPMDPNSQQVFDAFQNLSARLGMGSTNLLEGTDYPLTRLTRNYNLMNSLYRSHWIVRKIIDTIPEDMLKNWIEINSQISPEKIDKFNRAVRVTRTKEKLLAAMKWGRLYGGAAAVMLIEGHEDQLDMPLSLDMVMPGSYKGLLVLDRWSGISPSPDVIHDINNPEFGLPNYYRGTTVDGKAFKIHSSRVLRFIGRDVPFWEKQAEVGWGISEIEVVFDELKKRDNTSWNIASLVFLANLRVYKMGNLGQTLGMGTAKVQQNLFNTLEMQNWLMSNQGMQILDKEDDMVNRTFSFTGLNDIYQSFMLDVSGACEIPVTKLMGRSPAGMNATGESDLVNYYDMIGQRQESQVTPQTDKLFPVIAMSEFGEVPDDFKYKWLPARTVDLDKMADISSKKCGTVIESYNAGLISQQIGMKELRQQSSQTGLFTNITDEDINNASEELGMPGGPEFPVPVSSMSSLVRTPGQGQNARKPSKAADHDFTAEMDPTPGQKSAGNYKKGHVTVQGLDISIENPIGHFRSGDGWVVVMRHHYGYIRGTQGRDKDHIDCFVGPHPESGTVFVIDQVDPETGVFDEHKIMIGFDDISEARDAYLEHYPKDWQGIGAIWSVTMPTFKSWLKEANTTEPYGLGTT